MDKIEEAREILKFVGMPKAQQADICCYVLLAMAGIKPDMSWKNATNAWIRIHDIIQFANLNYETSYAENSREAIRKQEVLFYYSFESYKLPALNSHYLCYDLLRTKQNIEQKAITEGNFIPLSEEFENAIKYDMVLEKFLPTKEMLLGKRDKLKSYVDYTKLDYKAKINKYTEVAEYISEISDNVYLHTIYDVLIENIFSDNVNFKFRSFTKNIYGY